jgi:hypothetical protein
MKNVPKKIKGISGSSGFGNEYPSYDQVLRSPLIDRQKRGHIKRFVEGDDAEAECLRGKLTKLNVEPKEIVAVFGRVLWRVEPQGRVVVDRRSLEIIPENKRIWAEHKIRGFAQWLVTSVVPTLNCFTKKVLRVRKKKPRKLMMPCGYGEGFSHISRDLTVLADAVSGLKGWPPSPIVEKKRRGHPTRDKLAVHVLTAFFMERCGSPRYDLVSEILAVLGEVNLSGNTVKNQILRHKKRFEAGLRKLPTSLIVKRRHDPPFW